MEGETTGWNTQYCKISIFPKLIYTQNFTQNPTCNLSLGSSQADSKIYVEMQRTGHKVVKLTPTGNQDLLQQRRQKETCASMGPFMTKQASHWTESPVSTEYPSGIKKQRLLSQPIHNNELLVTDVSVENNTIKLLKSKKNK